MRELSLNVMDIAQNSISAGASLITIRVEEDRPADTLSISVEDNGKGMSPETVQKVIDPFYTTRTTRSVGLGVPLFKMEAEMTGGSFQIDSQLGVGTTLTAVFKPSSVDMIPLGDINGTVQLLISCNPTLDFIFYRSLRTGEGEKAGVFPADRRAPGGAGGGRPLGHPGRGALDKGLPGRADGGPSPRLNLKKSNRRIPRRSIPLERNGQ